MNQWSLVNLVNILKINSLIYKINPQAILRECLNNLQKQQIFLKSIVTVSDKAQIASYKVSQLIAQNMKAHTSDESIILPACKNIVSTMLGNKAALKISKIPLSDDTVCRRILKMSFDIEKNVSGNNLQCSDFALQVDESTDITNKAQLVAFVCFINGNKIANQFLFCKKLGVTAKGEDIFNILNDYLDKWQLLWKSCVGITFVIYMENHIN